MVKKKAAFALSTASLLLVIQVAVWPIPIYYWLAGEFTRELLSWQGQKLLTVQARGSWHSKPIANWKVLSSSQLSREGEIEKTDFLIVVFTPWELNGLSYQERIAYVRKATERAVELGADLVCDTSAADRARLSEKDHASTKLLKRAGIARAVVFDGGHHLPNLALDPELLLCPVIGGTDRQELIAHGFCRDALPVEKLMEIRELIGLNSAIITFPRFAGYLKSPQTLGTLCLEAARLLAASQPNASRKTQPLVTWGPKFSLFANGVLLWRPLPEQLVDFEGELAELIPGHKVKRAYLAVEGEIHLESTQRWELVTVGLSTWQIMLSKIKR